MILFCCTYGDIIIGSTLKKGLSVIGLVREEESKRNSVTKRDYIAYENAPSLERIFKISFIFDEKNVWEKWKNS